MIFKMQNVFCYRFLYLLIQYYHITMTLPLMGPVCLFVRVY